jgi:hypothetical protein
VVLDERYAEGQMARLPYLFAELIPLKVDILLAELFRYAKDLPFLSQGQTIYTMPFGCYQEAPDQVLGHGSYDQTA